MFRSKKESAFYKAVESKLIKEDVENHMISLSENVAHILKNKEEQKLKDMFAVIKKLIKSRLEAKNKFFCLLLLVEIMKSGEEYVLNHFISKMSARLISLTKHRVKDRTKSDLVEIGSTCLER